MGQVSTEAEVGGGEGEAGGVKKVVSEFENINK